MEVDPNKDSDYRYTVCPGSIDSFFIGSYFLEWAKTSWTYSSKEVVKKHKDINI